MSFLSNCFLFLIFDCIPINTFAYRNEHVSAKYQFTGGIPAIRVTEKAIQFLVNMSLLANRIGSVIMDSIVLNLAVMITRKCCHKVYINMDSSDKRYCMYWIVNGSMGLILIISNDSSTHVHLTKIMLLLIISTMTFSLL